MEPLRARIVRFVLIRAISNVAKGWRPRALRNRAMGKPHNLKRVHLTRERVALITIAQKRAEVQKVHDGVQKILSTRIQKTIERGQGLPKIGAAQKRCRRAALVNRCEKKRGKSDFFLPLLISDRVVHFFPFTLPNIRLARWHAFARAHTDTGAASSSSFGCVRDTKT